ncbi:MAG: dephospho-CoA kinase, partial [Nocardioides sp.]
VFADQTARRSLEAIVHPLVRARADELEAEAPAGRLVVHEIPLLVETDQAGAFDAVIVIDVPTEVQVRRLMDLRGLTEAEAHARIAAQADRGQRRAAATYLIENTGTLEDLRRRVREVFESVTTAAESS